MVIADHPIGDVSVHPIRLMCLAVATRQRVARDSCLEVVLQPEAYSDVFFGPEKFIKPDLRKKVYTVG